MEEHTNLLGGQRAGLGSHGYRQGAAEANRHAQVGRALFTILKRVVTERRRGAAPAPWFECDRLEGRERRANHTGCVKRATKQAPPAPPLALQTPERSTRARPNEGATSSSSSSSTSASASASASGSGSGSGSADLSVLADLTDASMGDAISGAAFAHALPSVLTLPLTNASVASLPLWWQEKLGMLKLLPTVDGEESDRRMAKMELKVKVGDAVVVGDVPAEQISYFVAAVIPASSVIGSQGDGEGEGEGDGEGEGEGAGTAIRTGDAGPGAGGNLDTNLDANLDDRRGGVDLLLKRACVEGEHAARTATSVPHGRDKLPPCMMGTTTISRAWWWERYRGSRGSRAAGGDGGGNIGGGDGDGREAIFLPPSHPQYTPLLQSSPLSLGTRLERAYRAAIADARTNSTTPAAVAHILSGGDITVPPPERRGGGGGGVAGLCILPPDSDSTGRSREDTAAVGSAAAASAAGSAAGSASATVYYSCSDVLSGLKGRIGSRQSMGRHQAQSVGLGYRGGQAVPEFLYVPSRLALMVVQRHGHRSRHHANTTSWGDRTSAVKWRLVG